MVYCSKCGSKNEDNSTFCQNCGIRLKPEEKPVGLSKYINLKAIIIGVISFFALLLIWWAFSIALTGNSSISTTSGYTLGVLIIILISTVMTGYLTGNNYRKGVLNALIVSVIWSIFWGIAGGFYIFIETLIILGIFAVIGGLIGVYLYRNGIVSNILSFLKN